MSNLDAGSFGDDYDLLSKPEQGFETRNYCKASGRTSWFCVHALGLFFADIDKPFISKFLISLFLSLLGSYKCPICMVNGTSGFGSLRCYRPYKAESGAEK